MSGYRIKIKFWGFFVGFVCVVFRFCFFTMGMIQQRSRLIAFEQMNKESISSTGVDRNKRMGASTDMKRMALKGSRDTSFLVRRKKAGGI